MLLHLPIAILATLSPIPICDTVPTFVMHATSSSPSILCPASSVIDTFTIRFRTFDVLA